MRILPYRSIDNFIAGVVITFVDVTAKSRAEERQKLLLAELQHRVRNTLAVVRIIARRTAENSGSVEAYAANLDGRLNALARTQALVTRDPEAGVDLEYLVKEELAAYRSLEDGASRVSGPEVRLRPKAAESFGLAVHELMTNAVKHGAFSADGHADISWRIAADGGGSRVIFEWKERGGPAVRGPNHRGFGSELLEQTLQFELQARTMLSFEADGLRCVIDLPASDQVIMMRG